MRVSAWLWSTGAVGLLVAAGAWFVLRAGDGGLPIEAHARERAGQAVALAVLGDSDSHAYHDALAFAPGSPARGGVYHASTFNWTETLARLRAGQLDPGPWVKWGSSKHIAAVRQVLGLAVARAPRKQDYLYNFAYSGAGCADLMDRPLRQGQAPSLAALMAQEPARWQHGVVVIRMGLNDWQGQLDLQSRDPHAPLLDAAIARCRARIGEAMALLRQRQPGLRFMVVGIGNEIDDPAQFDHFRSASASANVAAALARFNGALRELAEQTPGAAFFDQDAWFRRLWGSRTAQGQPIYRIVTVGESFQVTNTAGDDPHNALLADHHAGTVWNALWAQALVARLHEAFADLALTPVTDAELWRYLQPLVTAPPVRAPGS